jgi:membrane-associated protease RseP (regulator of RpoE activity)
MIVTVAVDGQPFRLLIDTGSPGEITLYPEAARRTRFWNDATIPYAPVRARGVGGQAGISRLVRAGQAQLGPVTFDRPLVRLDGGMRGQQSTDGVIGLPLIRGVNLATDVRRRRVLVQANRLPPDRARASLSGIWVDQLDGALVVADVGRGSPAAAAGIKPGDRIEGMDFASLIRKLGGKPGAMVELSIMRQGQSIPLRFKLADYI